MFYTSSNYNGRLPEEPNGLMNWPPIMTRNPHAIASIKPRDAAQPQSEGVNR